jgi:starch-binding outer membrane protein, SusD/RagB family
MKLHKNIFSITCAILILSTITSCEDFLDQKPYSQLSDSQFWKTNTDANSAVLGIYDAIQKHYREKIFLQGDIRSDSYAPSATAGAGALELMRNTLTANNSVNEWTLLYQAIGRANLCINKIPQIPGYDPVLLGEAKILRSFLYFDAIRLWGDVPLFTEPITSATQEILKPRTDANKIMTEIVIPDMLEAEKLISTAKNDFRFAKPSVLAFQAMVYMHLRQYANAKIAINKLIALRTHSLVNTRDAWQKMFLNETGAGSTGVKYQTGTELILSIQYSLTEDADRSGIYAIFFAGLPNYYISPALTTKWTTAFPIDSTLFKAKYPGFAPKVFNANGTKVWGDYRYFDSREAAPSGTTLPRMAKYNKTNYSPNNDDSNINLFRYADMILYLAEAENKLGNRTAAVTALNQIRDARQLPLVDTKATFTEAQLENLILDERQFEFLGEGKRWWDLVRTNKAVEVMGPINGQTAIKIPFPIFNTHLIENKLLVQNEGYR